MSEYGTEVSFRKGKRPHHLPSKDKSFVKFFQTMGGRLHPFPHDVNHITTQIRPAVN